MSSYLSSIVSTLRDDTNISFRNNLYMGDDINAIDVAYSETENHKLTAFFVPAETTLAQGDLGLFVETNYFNVYIFTPVEEDVAATDGWETAKAAAEKIYSRFEKHFYNGNMARCIGTREFRVGRGYYIYLMSCKLDVPKSSDRLLSRVTYFAYTGEVDGSATYTKSLLTTYSIDERYALSRVTAGIYRAYGCAVAFGSNVSLSPTQKDWFVIGTYNGSQSKAAALSESQRVYEVNSWTNVCADNGNLLGMIVVGA